MISGYFEGQIEPDDLGFWRGWSVFEAMEARGETIFHFEDHFERLIRSCEMSGISLPDFFSADTLLKQLKISLKIQKPNETLVKVMITQGNSFDHKIPEPSKSNWHYRILPLLKHENTPINLVVKRAIKSNFPEIKSIGPYHDAMILRQQAQKEGFDDFLYFDESVGITESSFANIFFIWHGEYGPIIYTQNQKILMGITRKIILDLARKENVFYKVHEWLPIFYQDLYQYTKNGECFLTSTSLGVHPVSLIKDVNGVIHKFKTGIHTETLKKLFLEYRENYFKKHSL